jgi:HK97 family phage major capsid protein
MNPTDMVSRALTAIENGPRHMSEAARERCAELVDMGNNEAPLIARHMLLTGSPQYHEEFQEYVRSMGHVVGPAMRAAMSTVGSAGGYLVPFTLDPTIILTNAGVVDPIRSISTVKTIATTTWEGVTSAGVTAEWIGENSEWSDASPTFAQPSITPKKAEAWVAASYEILADSGFASELGRLLADAKARLEAAAFATGNTGATVPRGVVAAANAVTASIVTSLTISAFAKGDVYNVSGALRPRDAEMASWIANKNVYNLIRQFDTAGGSSFWANLGMKQPPTLLDASAYQCSSMTSAITTGAAVLLAGNFSEFYIVDRVGMSILYEPIVRGVTNGRPTGQAGWAAFWRVASDAVDPLAFRVLHLETTATAVALA